MALIRSSFGFQNYNIPKIASFANIYIDSVALIQK